MRSAYVLCVAALLGFAVAGLYGWVPESQASAADGEPAMDAEAIDDFTRFGEHGSFHLDDRMEIEFKASDKPLKNDQVLALKPRRARSGRLLPGQYFPHIRGAFGLDLRRLKLRDVELAQYVQLGQRVSWLAVDSRLLTYRGYSYLQGYSRVEVLSLDSSSFTTSEMKYVAGFPKLHTLSLRNTRITNAGLKHLSTLQALRKLNLGNTNITSPAFAGADRLRQLSISYTKTDDAGVKVLGKMPKLRKLNLYGTNLTDAGAVWPVNCPNLETLNVGSIDQLGSAGLKTIGQLKQFKTLRLHRNDLSQTDLSPLANLTDLELLVLSQTGITGEEFEHLHGLKNLKRLEIESVKYDQAQLEALQKALPDCKISYSRWPTPRK